MWEHRSLAFAAAQAGGHARVRVSPRAPFPHQGLLGPTPLRPCSFCSPAERAPPCPPCPSCVAPRLLPSLQSTCCPPACPCASCGSCLEDCRYCTRVVVPLVLATMLWCRCCVDQTTACVPAHACLPMCAYRAAPGLMKVRSSWLIHRLRPWLQARVLWAAARRKHPEPIVAGGLRGWGRRGAGHDQALGEAGVMMCVRQQGGTGTDAPRMLCRRLSSAEVHSRVGPCLRRSRGGSPSHGLPETVHPAAGAGVPPPGRRGECERRGHLGSASQSGPACCPAILLARRSTCQLGIPLCQTLLRPSNVPRGSPSLLPPAPYPLSLPGPCRCGWLRTQTTCRCWCTASMVRRAGEDPSQRPPPLVRALVRGPGPRPLAGSSPPPPPTPPPPHPPKPPKPPPKKKKTPPPPCPPAGKDRTGLVAMLLLLLCGVERGVSCSRVLLLLALAWGRAPGRCAGQLRPQPG